MGMEVVMRQPSLSANCYSLPPHLLGDDIGLDVSSFRRPVKAESPLTVTTRSYFDHDCPNYTAYQTCTTNFHISEEDSVLKIWCNTVVRPRLPRPSQDRPVPVNQAARWRGVIVSRRAPGLCHPGRTCPPVRPQILLCTRAHRRTDRGCTEVKADELDLSGSVPESCL
ncbi:hypothetical protein Bbelb_272790 [Branchiostoma belcheri]|nr:hypothetical protein Bbelb_272790 [Branchiostoma belcheri]